MGQQRLAITIVTARVLMLRAGSVGLTDCGVLDPIWPFTGFTTDGQDYTLSNGMRADVGNTRILRAEAGTAVSYHMDLQKRYDAGTPAESTVRQNTPILTSES